MQEITVSEPRPPKVHRGYHGRVRSGCLTCRARKVKCDELRPVCHNCSRLKRSCVYRPRKSLYRSDKATPNPQSLLQSSESAHLTVSGPASQTYSSPLSEESDGNTNDSQFDCYGVKSPEVAHYPIWHQDSPGFDVTERLARALRHQNAMSATADDTEFEMATPSTLISRDIELTTTMDILATREASLELWFTFFVETVDYPPVAFYDTVNWRRMKLDMVELGITHAYIASAIIAVSTLYKGQLYGLPMQKAAMFYQYSKIAYGKVLEDMHEDFGTILVGAFVLCLYEFIHYETEPTLLGENSVFMQRLESWTQQPQLHTPLLSKICARLRLLHVSTLRGGGVGIVSDTVFDRLYRYSLSDIHTLGYSTTDGVNASTHLFETLSSPLQDLYFQLQMISSEVAKLTHYHRSRTTGLDQQEVVQQIAGIKSRLHALWEDRPMTQRQKPENLRSYLDPTISEPLVTLIGLCNAAYHAEFIEIGRVLGDPVAEATDSRQAMLQIRDIIEGDWNAYEGMKLNPGYLRPLFLYAIECMDHDENRWAVEKMEQIKNPICRSDFFASFGKALGDAQLRKGRRCTSKYFCIWFFGMPPPFL